MEKFNDFSRYKNNELRSYFSKKESVYDYKSPFSSSILSALTVAILWSLKENSLINYIENFYLKLLFYPIIILLAYLIIYFIYYKVFDLIQIFISRYYNTHLLTSKKQSEKYYLNKFKYEVVNQVALALSIISYKNKSIDVTRLKEFENNFYVVEAYYHLKEALLILQTKILLTPFHKKVIDVNYTKISLQRIKELLDLSINMYFDIRDYWKSQGVEEKYAFELKELKEIIEQNKELLQ